MLRKLLPSTVDTGLESQPTQQPQRWLHTDGKVANNIFPYLQFTPQIEHILFFQIEHNLFYFKFVAIFS